MAAAARASAGPPAASATGKGADGKEVIAIGSRAAAACAERGRRRPRSAWVLIPSRALAVGRATVQREDESLPSRPADEGVSMGGFFLDDVGKVKFFWEDGGRGG